MMRYHELYSKQNGGALLVRKLYEYSNHFYKADFANYILFQPRNVFVGYEPYDNLAFFVNKSIFAHRYVLLKQNR